MLFLLNVIIFAFVIVCFSFTVEIFQNNQTFTFFSAPICNETPFAHAFRCNTEGKIHMYIEVQL